MRRTERVRDHSLRELYWEFVAGQRRRLALLATCSAFGGFAEAGVLVLIARVAFALGSPESTVHIEVGPLDVRVSVWVLIGVAGALVLVRLAVAVLQAQLASTSITGVLRRTRTLLTRSFLGASWALQSAEREGRLQELLTSYAQQGASAVASLTTAMVAAFSFAALMVSALAVDPAAAVAVIVLALLLGALLRPIRAAVRRRSKRNAAANLAFATALTELAATTQEVRIFEVEDAVRGRLGALINTHAQRLQRTRFLAQLAPALYHAAALLIVVAVLAGAYASDVSGLAALGAVVLILVRSLSYGQSLQTALQGLHEGAPYIEMLRSEDEKYRAAAIPRDGEPLDALGEVAFEDVSFEYVPEVPVLHDVSFRVPKGDVIGIIGPSGAGKSTLVQLLLRLRDPTHGKILADGRDVQGLALDDWYHRVTYVPQEPRFFAGTVADNIRFLRDGIGDADVEDAARRAHLHDDVMSWREGYDTPVGERGGALSGGQRQRVCIARALVGEPDLVVLDEPTSALDAKSEALMRDTMRALAPRSTVFVIAHRLSTLTICDRIMVILEGRLQAFDEPKHLEQDDAFYREVLELSGMR